MATVKIQNGNVVLQNGSVSCECCAPACSNAKDSFDAEIQLTASAYASLYAGGQLSFTAGSTANMSSVPNAEGGLAQLSGNLTIQSIADTSSNSCFTENISFTNTVTNNTISVTVTPPGSPYDTLHGSFIPNGGAYLDLDLFSQYGIRLNKNELGYFAYVAFQISFVYVVYNRWVDTSTGNFAYASAGMANVIDARNVPLVGSTQTSVDLSVDELKFPFDAYFYVLRQTGGGAQWNVNTTAESTAVFDPAITELTFVSAAP